MSPTVETITEFVQVLMKMFFTQTMIGTNNKSSEVTDKRMHMREYAVRLASFDDMRFVSKSVCFKRRIHRQAIGANRTSLLNNCFGKLHDGCRIDLLHGLQSGKSYILCIPFACEKGNRNKHRGLVGAPTPFSPLCRGSDEQFVHFHRFGKLILRIPFRHGVTDSLEHRPRGIVVHPNLSCQQQGGVATFVRSDEKDGEKPALQRNARLVKDCSSRRRVETQTVATLVHTPRGDTGVKIRLATPFAHHTFRPTYTNEMVLAGRLCRKSGEEVHHVQRLIGVGHDSTVSYQNRFSVLTR